jgi:hypothetical protein
MSYMRSTDSAVLQEFGRIMQEKDELKKVAQVNPDAFEAYKNKLLDLQLRAQKPNPNHDPRLMISKRDLEQLVQLGRAVSQDFAQQAMGVLAEYDAGRDPKPVLLGLKTHEELAKVPRTPNTPRMPDRMQNNVVKAPIPSTRAALSTREKTADQKAYDVTGKEDIVQQAHPKTSIVSGDVVENLNEQQDADLLVAEKSAKNVLLALYKLAKRLRAEKNEKAYVLVKETFLELSKSLKK